MRHLHPDEIREIFRSDRSYAQLAHDYSVNVSTVSRIKARKNGAEHTEGMASPIRRPGRRPKSTYE